MSCWFEMAVWQIQLYLLGLASPSPKIQMADNTQSVPTYITQDRRPGISLLVYELIFKIAERGWLVGNGCLAHAAFASFHDSFHGGTNPNWRRIVAHVYYIYSTYII